MKISIILVINFTYKMNLNIVFIVITCMGYITLVKALSPFEKNDLNKLEITGIRIFLIVSL